MYRSELHTLRARVRELEAEIDDHDRRQHLGTHAKTWLSRFAFALGKLASRPLAFFHPRSVDASEVARLKERLAELERRVAEQEASAESRPQVQRPLMFRVGRRIGRALPPRRN